jgi:NAD(P)-dependent dehydrogenase (short-subunit alcohol dehydrogenase family)
MDFGQNSITARYTPCMKGKIVVITGATSGIGQVVAEKLASMGARVVFVARDKSRAEDTLARLRKQNPGVDHRAHYADLSRIAEMKRVALEIAGDEATIDVLMNNAGAMFSNRQITEDGLERTFALNHMSYFVITQLLRERLLATPGARIVNTASNAHRTAHVDYNDLQMMNGYRMFKAYCLSKLYNILFTRELSRQLLGTGVTANCLHPGFVATRFGDETSGAGGFLFRGIKRFAITPEQGAETPIFLASSEQVKGVTGEYFYKSAPTTPTKDATDDAAARWLWAESEKILAVRP